jgi:hypothetical protein
MKRKKQTIQFLPIIFIVLFLLLGVGGLYDSTTELVVGHRSKKWHKHPATIIQNKYWYKEVIHGPNHHFDISYTYQVENKKYESNRVRVAGNPDEIHYKVLFKVGNIVPVYVNPKEHSESVLIPGQTKGVYGRLTFSLVLLGLSGLCIYYWLDFDERKQKQNRNKSQTLEKERLFTVVF